MPFCPGPGCLHPVARDAMASAQSCFCCDFSLRSRGTWALGGSEGAVDLAQGTKSRPGNALEKEVESMGAHLSAYSTREHTAYYIKALSQDLPKGTPGGGQEGHPRGAGLAPGVPGLAAEQGCLAWGCVPTPVLPQLWSCWRTSCRTAAWRTRRSRRSGT